MGSVWKPSSGKLLSAPDGKVTPISRKDSPSSPPQMQNGNSSNRLDAELGWKVSRPDYDDTTDLDQAQPEPRISAFEARQAPPRAMRPYSLSNQHSLLAAEHNQHLDYGTTNRVEMEFVLRSRRTRSSSTKASSWTTGQWTIGDGTVRGPDDFRADIKDSFRKVCFRGGNWGGKDNTQVYVKFNKPKKQQQKSNPNHYFSVKDSTERKNLKEFLKAIKNILQKYDDLESEKNTSIFACLIGGPKYQKRVKQITTLLDALDEYPEYRRRMAQREFSSRRDSPVMVRLLQEIIDAQDK